MCPGGLEAFKKLDEDGKRQRRGEAIAKIGQECSESEKVGVVAGHLMLWEEGEKTGTLIHTQEDLET